MNPSDLPWWGWLIGAIGGGILAAIIGSLGSRNDRYDWISVPLFFAVILATIGCFAIGIIRFIKWVWAA
jgi:hypothetical protein